MAIFLNAFPIRIPNKEIEVSVVAYDERLLKEFRVKYKDSHIFRRRGGKEILIFSENGQYPVLGKIEKINLTENYSIFCFLVKNGLKKHLSNLNRFSTGFNPIELVSTKAEDNLLSKIIHEEYPFQIFLKYKIDTKIIHDTPCLIIDCATRTTINKPCLFFIQQGFNLTNRYVVKEQEDGYRKVIGQIAKISEDQIQVISFEGSKKNFHANEIYLEASRKNFDDYLSYTHGIQQEKVSEKIRLAISSFNGGENKKKRIEGLKVYFQSKGVIDLIDGTQIEVLNAENVQSLCLQMQKPIFIFNDNGEASWAEQGFTRYGPYTKRTFDRNAPSICVICAQRDKGRVEQFVRKFLKGISNHKYYGSGLEGKFSIGTSQIEVFTTVTDDVAGYKNAIESAIQKKSEDGSKWDLALVQVRQSFKKLGVSENPYYVGKSLLFLHQVPVQDFTIELLSQQDYSLGYSLNNMALACYAKMGGVPWLLKSSPTLSHELVIGIGSANITQQRGTDSQRIMGITTVFSGDGSYIVSNTSKAVIPDKYCDALTSSLGETIEKIQKRMNWQKGDTIRLIFHASVKKFNKDEIQAVRAVIDKYRNYQIEYAFLKISENHGLHLFDYSTKNEGKGKFAPKRGKALKLSKYEMLIYLIGQRELKNIADGHPRGVILNIHRDSTFKDLKYLSTQLYSFSSHSWRSYFPNPMPVTISYSNLIAQNLGWLNQLPKWDDSIMIGKVGQSQWFL